MIRKAFTLSYDDGINQDRRFLDLINKYNLKCTFNLKTDKPQIFYLWGHTYEFDGRKDWERIEEFFKLISGREDIYYASNYDVFNYYGLIK